MTLVASITAGMKAAAPSGVQAPAGLDLSRIAAGIPYARTAGLSTSGLQADYAA